MRITRGVSTAAQAVKEAVLEDTEAQLLTENREQNDRLGALLLLLTDAYQLNATADDYLSVVRDNRTAA